MRSLPLFHRIAGQPVIVLGKGEAAEPKRRLVERAGGLVVTDLQEGIDRGARLAFVAHDDAAMCEADAIRLRTSGLLVNVVDRPELCDFTTPSILDRDPVLVAVGTSGASAGLAKQLRLRLEALLPAELGRLAERLQQARAALRAKWPEAGERRRALDEALGPGGTLDPLSGHVLERFEHWLDRSEAQHPGQVIEIHLASDDPDDLTLRQLRILGSADIVECDQGVAPAILERARADAARRPLSSAESSIQGLVVRLKKKSR
jgi:uroporphyrin-III C-methyltransferase/precorrin-2 dehydrogenase/sirohydrochlorin ferrochelatase